MHSSLGGATKKQVRRFQILSEVGCLCCRLVGIEDQPAEIHHILSGSRRISHDHVVALCEYHHRGIPRDGYTQQEMEEHLGPSIALNKKQFIKEFGTDEELLEMQEQVYQLYCSLSKT